MITDWTLCQLIGKHPGENVYALSKAIGWSTGKVYASVKRRPDDGQVLFAAWDIALIRLLSDMVLPFTVQPPRAGARRNKL
jgi:hypothetical protein